MAQAYKCDRCETLIERPHSTDHRYIKADDGDEEYLQWLCQFNVQFLPITVVKLLNVDVWKELHTENVANQNNDRAMNAELCRDCFILYLQAFSNFLISKHEEEQGATL